MRSAASGHEAVGPEHRDRDRPLSLTSFSNFNFGRTFECETLAEEIGSILSQMLRKEIHESITKAMNDVLQGSARKSDLGSDSTSDFIGPTSTSIEPCLFRRRMATVDEGKIDDTAENPLADMWHSEELDFSGLQGNELRPAHIPTGASSSASESDQTSRRTSLTSEAEDENDRPPAVEHQFPKYQHPSRVETCPELPSIATTPPVKTFALVEACEVVGPTTCCKSKAKASEDAASKSSIAAAAASSCPMLPKLSSACGKSVGNGEGDALLSPDRRSARRSLTDPARERFACLAPRHEAAPRQAPNPRAPYSGSLTWKKLRTKSFKQPQQDGHCALEHLEQRLALDLFRTRLSSGDISEDEGFHPDWLSPTPAGGAVGKPQNDHQPGACLVGASIRVQESRAESKYESQTDQERLEPNVDRTIGEPAILEKPDTLSSTSPCAISKTYQHASFAVLQASKDQQAIEEEIIGTDFAPETDPRYEVLADMLPRAFGVVPLARGHKVKSSVYQVAIVFMNLVCVVHLALQIITTRRKNQSCFSSGLYLDCVVAFGSFVGLLACKAHRRSEALVACKKLLVAYAKRHGFVKHWRKRVVNCLLIGCCIAVAAMLVRAICFSTVPGSSSLNFVVFALATSVNVGLAAYIIQCCCCLSLMLDVFCYNVIEHSDFADAMREWHLIHALCREVSRTTQVAFAVCQATGVAVAWVSIAGWRTGALDMVQLLPGLLLVLAMVLVSALAARVSDKCARASVLVNSSSDRTFDRDRMYVVDYIDHSQAGFYVFDVRITTSNVFKTMYISCAVVFAAFGSAA